MPLAKNRGTGFKDITGMRFGRMLVLEFSHVPLKKPARWFCRCDCGKEKTVCGSHLRNGSIQSCGCLVVDTNVKRLLKHGHAKKRNRSKEYITWRSAKVRCTDGSSEAYLNYGGRGIKMCQRWVDSFDNFLKDMGPKPSGRTLGRINNDGNYEPSNCRWETMLQQSNNKRNNRLITFRGETKTMAEWCRSLGLRKNKLAKRLAMGWSMERASSCQ